MGKMSEAMLGDRVALPTYPETPGFKTYGTSQEAASKADRFAGNLREISYATIVGAGARGMTADEVAEKLGKSVLSIRPRVSELVAQERIQTSGERRTNSSGMRADVYIQNRRAVVT